MQSFRTELENPVVEQDIIELEKKIRLFHEGSITDENFRSLRLARGVYGQRQAGVQMIRIKLPYGKVMSNQLRRIADVADEYSTGNLHITTRQDIQIHYVSLDRTPQLWAELEKDNVTLREACGNTVRNITASPSAGVDYNELFDVSPYAHALFEYCLRNPVCQEMGRKVKISFSSTDADDALSYIHDLGFIAKTKIVDGKEVRGFKVLLAGGLGSQSRHADVAFEFLEADKIIPYTEAVLRVFDRHGERSRRLKARLKFLVKDLGFEAFSALVAEEQLALKHKTYPIDGTVAEVQHSTKAIPQVNIEDKKEYQTWLSTNVKSQRQAGFNTVGILVSGGNFSTAKARILAELLDEYAAGELRFTLRQNILLRHISDEALPFFYQELKKLGFAKPGYETTFDITSCPGTDTCNLGISSSTGIAEELERVLENEYPHLVNNVDISIKISGCMNSCGQHMMSEIGFQGMSVKVEKHFAPALQVLLGGKVLGNGEGKFSEKVIKIPSKRGPEALRMLLNDFAESGSKDFIAHYEEKGKEYFFNLLKPLSDTTNLQPSDFIDWGHDDQYVQQIGVGECAGVVIDLVSTLFLESDEKLAAGKRALNQQQWADGIYHGYTAMINSAKALLLAAGEKTNSQAQIVKAFTAYASEKEGLEAYKAFDKLIYQIQKEEPTEAFAADYFQLAIDFHTDAQTFRKKETEQ